VTIDAPRTSETAVAWVRADAVRLAGLASLAAAAVWFDLVAVALMLLVLGGLMVPRAIGTLGSLDAVYGLGLLVAAWSAVLGVYEQVAWWDVAMHTVVTGLIAAVAHRVVVVLRVARGPADAAGPRDHTDAAALTTGLGLGLSVLWEIGEWLGHTYLDPSIHVSGPDTLGDLVAGGLGSLAAGLALRARSREHALR